MGKDWPRPVVAFGIESPDPSRAREFYAALFNWDIGDGPIMQIEAGVGGPEPGPVGHIRQSESNRVALYVQVRDLTDSLEKASALGGSVIAQPFDVPGAPTLAVIADPDGNPIGLVQQ